MISKRTASESAGPAVDGTVEHNKALEDVCTDTVKTANGTCVEIMLETQPSLSFFSDFIWMHFCFDSAVKHKSLLCTAPLT